MWLTVGPGVYLEVDFWHTHDGGHHLHDAALAEVEAHALAHRLASYHGATEPRVR